MPASEPGTCYIQNIHPAPEVRLESSWFWLRGQDLQHSRQVSQPRGGQEARGVPAQPHSLSLGCRITFSWMATKWQLVCSELFAPGREMRRRWAEITAGGLEGGLSRARAEQWGRGMASPLLQAGLRPAQSAKQSHVRSCLLPTQSSVLLTPTGSGSPGPLPALPGDAASGD